MNEVERRSATVLASDSPANIKNMIYVIRGQQVMLDSDLAMLYEVETKNLNKAAARNTGRFPEDFRFRLTREEVADVRFQFGTLAGQSSDIAKVGRTYLPWAYTEQGIAMLSSVLRSDTAVSVSVAIMRTFVSIRQFLANNALMFQRLDEMEARHLAFEKNTGEKFERVFDYLETHEEPRQMIFFEGQVYDAFKLLTEIVGRAKRSIALVDGYIDVHTLNILAKKHEGVAATIWTSRRGNKLTSEDIEAFNVQYPPLEVKRTEAFHDRFLILDAKNGYHIGASLKDAGKKSFGINRLEDPEIAGLIIKRLEQLEN